MSSKGRGLASLCTTEAVRVLTGDAAMDDVSHPPVKGKCGKTRPAKLHVAHIIVQVEQLYSKPLT